MAKVKRRERPLDQGCLFRNTCPVLHRRKENKIQHQIQQMQKERRAGESPAEGREGDGSARPRG